VTPSDPEPQPILRHSIGWSLGTAALAVTLVAYAWGAAYGGTDSRVSLAGLLVGAGVLAVSGAAYAAFLLLRRPATVARLTLAPIAVLGNVLSLMLAITAASDLRW
jgi:uncharacterized membrane protein